MATVCKRIISPEALDCAVIEPNHIDKSEEVSRTYTNNFLL